MDLAVSETMGKPNHASLIIVIQNFWKSLPDLFRNIIRETKKTVKKSSLFKLL